VPDRPAPAEALDRITADALALRRALRTNATNHAHALAALIPDAQDLAGTTLWLFLDLAQHTPRTSADLLLLDRVAQIAPRPALDRRTAASRAWSGLYWCWYVAVAGRAGAGPEGEQCL
jgi:hypothetical protein